MKDYDERQELVRGRAYKYGFFTVAAISSVLMIYCAFEQKDSVNVFFSMLSVFSGIVVFAAYCIWHDAFFTLKKKPTSYIILFTAITFIDFLNVYLRLSLHEKPIAEHFGDSSFALSLLGGVTFLAVLINILVKLAVDRKREAE